MNEYLSGQGIHAHEDGAAYFPVVATVTLGSHCVFNITPKSSASREKDKWRILQEPRSLLITSAEMYTDFLHGIDEVKVDEGLGGEEIANWDLLGNNEPFAKGKRERGTRVSLTFRDVLKVRKLGKAFGGLGK